jgi:hypothetical protein
MVDVMTIVNVMEPEDVLQTNTVRNVMIWLMNYHHFILQTNAHLVTQLVQLAMVQIMMIVFLALLERPWSMEFVNLVIVLVPLAQEKLPMTVLLVGKDTN